jgi:hypothetical protein
VQHSTAQHSIVSIAQLHHLLTAGKNLLMEIIVLGVALLQGVPSVVHTPIIHARSPHTAIMDAVAGFLIGAGGAEHSYLMYGTSWTSDKGWPWSPLFDLEYGKPLGPPKRSEVAGGNVVWERRFASGAVATITCPPKSRSCPGNITGITIPPAQTDSP